MVSQFIAHKFIQFTTVSKYIFIPCSNSKEKERQILHLQVLNKETFIFLNKLFETKTKNFYILGCSCQKLYVDIYIC